MKKYLSLSAIALLAACAGGPDIERSYDYVISDMAASERPEWLDSENIAELNATGDGYRYYVGENDTTASKATKALCRTAAEAKARYDLASAIETKIKSSYNEIESSNATAEEESAKKSEATLDRSLIVDQLVGGAEKYKDYWEQRAHKKDKGAAKDYKDYSCNTLIRIKQETYESIIKAASDSLVDSLSKKPEDAASLKEQVAAKAIAPEAPAAPAQTNE